MKMVLTLILISCAVLACGCTHSPDHAGQSPGTAAGLPVTLSPAMQSVPLTSGPGVIVISFRTDGADKMVFDLASVSTPYDASTVLSTSGPYAGSIALQVPAKGTYWLNISGSSRWTAEAAWLTTTSPLTVPVNLSGPGTMVSHAIYLQRGEYIFQRNETGPASPIYMLQYANGSYLMDANNTYPQPRFGLFSAHPFLFVTVPEDGTYFLSALCRDNPGPWSASILPMPKIPPMGPGPAIPEHTPYQGNNPS